MNISIKQINEAAKRLEGVVYKTPLQYSKRMSDKFGANVYIKREDMQEVRSYKIRGAYNKIASLSDVEKKHGIVIASAGNHAQGVAFACSHLKIHGTIFMPSITPLQKIERVRHFDGKYVKIKLVGHTYDQSAEAAHEYAEKNSMVYVHAFNDPLTIAGQGTVGKEIVEQLPDGFDIFIAPIGGGGFISGASEYIKQVKPNVKIFGAEPENAASMNEAIKQNKVIKLPKIDTFVDGAAVQQVGDLTFKICKRNVEKIAIVSVGRICKTMVDLYQNEGIISEPAGALSIAGLSSFRSEIKGKIVVCVLSGSNNDILRYPEILEKSLVYQGLKHYFIIEFAQKPGQLRKFLDEALGPNDDIVRFEYMKKTNREKGAALVGIELKDKNDLHPLLDRLTEAEFKFHKLSNKELLYDYII